MNLGPACNFKPTCRASPAHSINQSAWAEAYYRQQKAKGCSHQAALRALAFKWIRIVYRCWKARVPYDESIYLQALTRHNSPLMTTPEATKAC